MKSNLDQFRIAQIAGGEGFPIPAPRFGPMFASQIRLQSQRLRRELIEFPHISSEYDDVIQQAFERLRDGLSVDRFLSDPNLSRELRQECAKLGLRAEEAAINLRLLTLRKRSGGGVFKETKRPVNPRDVVERLGLGVEYAMRHIAIRYGASVDDMLAHPRIGAHFVDLARAISAGGTEVEYRTCALQIRKGRHITGAYQDRVDELRLEMIEKRWNILGAPKEGWRKPVPDSPGILELREDGDSLFVIRTHHLGSTVKSMFSPRSIERLVRRDFFEDIDVSSTSLRFVTRRELPAGTPKAWELLLIRDLQPRFNWPVSVAA